MVLQINEIIVVVFLFIIIKKNVQMSFPKQSDSFNSVVLCRKKYLAVVALQ